VLFPCLSWRAGCFAASQSGTPAVVTEPKQTHPVLSSGDPATPARALGGVMLIVFVAVAIIAGVAYTLWSVLN
jgi:hypothetical protein